MSNADGLRQHWGLGEAQVPAAASGQQASQFRAAFVKSIAAVNESLQYTSAHADPAAHLQLNMQREAVYAAYQAVSSKIDPNDPSKAQPSIDRVLANVNALQSKAAALKKETEAGKTTWQAREADFDRAGDQLLEMSDGGYEKANAFRAAFDAIVTKVKERNYPEALAAFDKFLQKLAPAYAEFRKPKEPSAPPTGEPAVAANQSSAKPAAATAGPVPTGQSAPATDDGGVWGSISSAATSAWKNVSWAGNEIHSGMKFNADLVQQGEHALSGMVDSAQDTAAAKVQGWADMADGIPGLEQAADVAAWGFDQNTQVIAGVYEGAIGLGAGLVTIVANPVDTAKGLATMAEHAPIVPFAPNPFKMVHGLYDVVVEGADLGKTADRVFNPATQQKEDAEFWANVGKAFLEPYGRTIGEDGDYMKAVGRAGFDIAGFFIGAGEAKAASMAGGLADDAARLGTLADDAARAGAVADDAAKAGTLADDAARAGKLADDVARATGTDGKAVASAGDDAGRSAGAADNAGGSGTGGGGGGGGGPGGGGGGKGGGGGGGGGKGGPGGPSAPRPPFPAPPEILKNPGVLERLRELITRKKPVPTDEMIKGSKQAAADVPKGYKDPTGVWDQTTLNSEKAKAIKQGLDEFDAGTRGKSVKELDLRGKTPEQVHEELLDAGFEFNPDPKVNVIKFKDATGTVRYKTLDGKWTTNLDDPAGLAPQYIYTHPDGGMVRVKPFGDPGSPVRPEPHVNKCVLDGKGTDWDNELFKVTNDVKNGTPVPKAPNSDSGLPQSRVPKRQDDPLKGTPEDLEANGYANKVMDEAHADLPLPPILGDPPPKLP